MHFVARKLRPFWFSIGITAAVLIAVALGLGASAVFVTLVLIAIEITFSFDNAIINAKTLGRLSPLWQKLFLTLGIVIAIFGMRIIFPIVIVMATAHLTWANVIHLAFHEPHVYADKLLSAHTTIAAFGGAFLLLLALNFFLDDSREIVWVKRFERPLQKLSAWWAPPLITFIILETIASLSDNGSTVLRAGIVGIIVYGAIQGVIVLAESLDVKPKASHKTGLAALSTFIYLEILDASFSFDGVIGAFAITSSVILIAAGLGAGAVWVRSLTLFMVRKNTLDEYKYLEHGAHYTVGMLALLLLTSVLVNIPDFVTGMLGLVIIGLALRASIIEKA